MITHENQISEDQEVASSIRKQIDEIRQSQAGMLKEINEIKKLLRNNPDRDDLAPKQLPPSSISLNVHGEPYRGHREARIGIVEYSNFECPYCARYAREIFPEIDSECIQTGKVKYFFRDFALEPNALLKARAARCAGEQGKFWEMRDRLFASQADPAAQDMIQHALALGLDIQKFKAGLAGNRYSGNLAMSVAGARKVGVFEAPAFLIGTASEDGNFIRITKLLVGGEYCGTIKAALDESVAMYWGKRAL